MAAALHCRRCGYNLYRLRADGACPECGLEVWETILHSVDPAASRLPRVRDPAAVGNALLVLVVCAIVAGALQVVRPVALWLDAMDPSGLRVLAGWAPPELSFVSALAALAGQWAVVLLAPRRGDEPGPPVRRAVWLLGLGLAGWTLLAVAVGALHRLGAPQWTSLAARIGLAGSAVAALLGLRGVLRTIGLRSRAYRTARGGRQGIAAMIAAIGGVAAGLAVLLIASLEPQARYLATAGVVTVAISALMVLVGLVYLAVNVWWIRRSLMTPPPQIKQLLVEQGP